tara:strand:+ start:262 stop:1143 length:882 start_codon:yes stop_codon:yes gene_type:complete
MAYPQMICDKDIDNFFNVRSLHDKKTTLKNIDSDKKDRLNILVDNYVSQNHTGDKQSSYNLKGKLKYKITQSGSQNSSHMFGHFEVWCEKEQYRMKYENATSTNMGLENSMLKREISELKAQLNRYKNNDLSPTDKSPKIPMSNINDVYLESSRDLSVEDKSPKNPPQIKEEEKEKVEVSKDLSVEDKSPKIPAKIYEYKKIDWDNLLQHSQNQTERDRIFIDTLRYIGDEVFENYKESIESSFDISPILERHYDFLVETWEQDCPEKYDIDDKLIGNIYNIVNNSFDTIISS